ncbi:MAG: M23 family metallopeptidase [Sphingomonas sp.]|nr:M23 family metallopeptidase [Sphingomonas sp.]
MAGVLFVCTAGSLLAQGVQPVSAQEPSSAGQPAPKPAPFVVPANSQRSPTDGNDASLELFVRLRPGDTIRELLVRAGVGESEAVEAGALIASARPAGIAPGTEIAILLGGKGEGGKRDLERMTMRTGLELKLAVTKATGSGFRLVREDIAVDATPLRFQGRGGAGLYWSLRARGVPADAAAEFTSLVGAKLGGSGGARPDDRFDLILAQRKASTGEREIGPLLYAAVDRRQARDVRLVNGSVLGRAGWFDADSGAGTTTGLMWPVAGRISSRFGTRFHPILRFARSHSGVDVSASWGSPIVAAADGRVVGAGWNGGHGRQVRIRHRSGLETSYSHLSGVVADLGAGVRQGQLIGYVGSTGFSTGPHLHYEVRERGRAVDPLRLGHALGASLSEAERQAVQARLRQLLAIDGSQLASAATGRAAS